MRKKRIKNKYFTLETEDAIIEYNDCDNLETKNRIFEEKIYFPFFKLTQNIIHSFKFYYTDIENLEDLQHEIIIFLLSKIHLFNHKKNIQSRLEKIIVKTFDEKYDGNFIDYYQGIEKINQKHIDDFINKLEVSDECFDRLKKITPPKAFSYFGTITKRWLILYNNNNYKKVKNNLKTEVLEDNNNYSYNIEFNPKNSPKGDIEKLSFFIDKYIEYCTNNVYNIFREDIDSKISDSILELFRRREGIEIFNKKALYINIKENINVNTPKITKVSDKLKYIFYQNYTKYLNTGIIKFPNPDIYNKKHYEFKFKNI